VVKGFENTRSVKLMKLHLFYSDYYTYLNGEKVMVSPKLYTVEIIPDVMLLIVDLEKNIKKHNYFINTMTISFRYNKHNFILNDYSHYIKNVTVILDKFKVKYPDDINNAIVFTFGIK
jgi:hypothetical protein